MKFSLQYNTVWGEELRLVSADGQFPMKWNEGNVWTVELKSAPKEYHYAVFKGDRLVRRENGGHSLCKGGQSADRWIDWPVSRGAGTVVPVFSLRSEGDFGIGDFADLRLLADWAADCGQSIIQLLPINDTTRHGGWEDSYPYSPVSSFALNPLYMRLQELGIEETDAFTREREQLNSREELDYPEVFAAKMKYIRQAYGKRGAEDLSGRECRSFIRKNRYWLDEYASFCARRDGLEKDYYRWMQYHLDRQLSEVVAYAASKGVRFKGDLPIGVSRDSVEAHFHPELFNLDASAGAPPDFFSEHGQNWGFPTYNWEAMAVDSYAWWKARLRKMSEYFAAYRVDHIIGWFRIWEIPSDQISGKFGHFNPALPYSGKEIKDAGLPADRRLFIADPRRRGWYHPLINPDTSFLEPWQKERFDALWNDFFFHRHNEFWKRKALEKIPALIGATGMLPCGEDLGMVPACVQDVMDEYRILSLEMPGMDKGRDWPRCSVCTTSTHDMSPLRCSRGGDLTPGECVKVIRDTLSSQSMLAVLPLQDWLSIDGNLRKADAASERINEPADPHHHWRWRMHLTLERLTQEKGFSRTVETLLEETGRKKRGE